MKIRKHRNNKLFKITWSQRAPVVVQTHLMPSSHGEKVVMGGVMGRPCFAFGTGDNPRAVRDAFLFGRDRTNIVADISEVSANSAQVHYYETGLASLGGSR